MTRTRDRSDHEERDHRERIVDKGDQTRQRSAVVVFDPFSRSQRTSSSGTSSRSPLGKKDDPADVEISVEETRVKFYICWSGTGESSR